jgi:hypothetical protein
MTDEEIKAINNLKIQQIFVYSLILASGISVYINNGQIDLIKNKEKAKVTPQELYKIGRTASIIVWIASIYFLITNFDTYNKEKTKQNASFLTAAFLAFQASSIRLNTVINNPIDNITSEDIV